MMVTTIDTLSYTLRARFQELAQVCMIDLSLLLDYSSGTTYLSTDVILNLPYWN